MTTQQLILIFVAVVLLVVIITMYNGFVQAKNKTQEAFSLMDVYLKKRYDVIPNLVAVVKGYASHEAEILAAVTQQRSGATERDSQLKCESQITSALINIMAVAEAYPELKADKNFSQLHEQLVLIEDDIAKSRRYYNGAVREFNNRCQTVPNNIIAAIFGFKPQPMFEAGADERRSINVNV